MGYGICSILSAEHMLGDEATAEDQRDLSAEIELGLRLDHGETRILNANKRIWV